jgi:hypothetical protein
MANLKDLVVVSLTEMSVDEGLELIRQTRLSRRIPVKKPKKTTKATQKKRKAPPKVSTDQAAELLKLLTGG